jgi:hypothetical protein
MDGEEKRTRYQESNKNVEESTSRQDSWTNNQSKTKKREIIEIEDSEPEETVETVEIEDSEPSGEPAEPARKKKGATDQEDTAERSRLPKWKLKVN